MSIFNHSIHISNLKLYKELQKAQEGVHTTEALKIELMKYKAHASKKYNQNLDEQEALDNFVDTIDSLTMNEVSEWRNSQIQTSDSQKSINNQTML